MNVIHVLGPLALAGVVFGCNKSDHGGTAMERDRAQQTTVTGATMSGAVNNEAAIDRIVAADCEHEARCKNIGTDKHYSSRETCTRDVKGKLQGDLKPSDCPNGIDNEHLDDCLKSIRQESCGKAIESLSRVTACNTSRLCLEKGEKPSTK